MAPCIIVGISWHSLSTRLLVVYRSFIHPARPRPIEWNEALYYEEKWIFDATLVSSFPSPPFFYLRQTIFPLFVVDEMSVNYLTGTAANARHKRKEGEIFVWEAIQRERERERRTSRESRGVRGEKALECVAAPCVVFPVCWWAGGKLEDQRVIFFVFVSRQRDEIRRPWTSYLRGQPMRSGGRYRVNGREAPSSTETDLAQQVSWKIKTYSAHKNYT